jgi:hypothetical protein
MLEVHALHQTGEYRWNRPKRATGLEICWGNRFQVDLDLRPVPIILGVSSNIGKLSVDNGKGRRMPINNQNALLS